MNTLTMWFTPPETDTVVDSDYPADRYPTTVAVREQQLIDRAVAAAYRRFRSKLIELGVDSPSQHAAEVTLQLKQEL